MKEENPMPDKDPSTYGLITYAWVVVLAILGGLVSHLNKLANGTPFSWLRFFTDILTAALTGVVTFYFCEAAGITQTFTAALVGISGHMGSRLLFALEAYYKKRLLP